MDISMQEELNLSPQRGLLSREKKKAFKQGLNVNHGISRDRKRSIIKAEYKKLQIYQARIEAEKENEDYRQRKTGHSQKRIEIKEKVC
jgi:hypothetical protein